MELRQRLDDVMNEDGFVSMFGASPNMSRKTVVVELPLTQNFSNNEDEVEDVTELVKDLAEDVEQVKGKPRTCIRNRHSSRNYRTSDRNYKTETTEQVTETTKQVAETTDIVEPTKQVSETTDTQELQTEKKVSKKKSYNL